MTASTSWSTWLERITLLPAAPSRRMIADQVAAGDRVGAGERLVEEEDERVVDEGLGELGPLPHPLGVAADGAVGVLGHADLVEHPGGRLARRRRRRSPPSRAQVSTNWRPVIHS